MELERVAPVNNQLLSDFWAESEKLKPFYEYTYNDESFKTRANYLKEKNYNYIGLSEVVRKFMEPYGISQKSDENLRKLEHGALAVVGGQQAGVLTGPLYSVHKAISVILLAKEQSEKLGIDVVPIFWIAGEDHDIDEINHTFTFVDEEPKKKVYQAPPRRKTMASKTEVNETEIIAFINEVFKDYGETEFTKELYEAIIQHGKESQTYTDFFARLMNDLFKDEGLLMIDSAFQPFRQYQSPYFEKMIEKNEAIAASIIEKERLYENLGYGTPILATEENANLFYVQNGERFLLERKNDKFINLTANVKFSKEELLQIARLNPEQLSNNVVTRPLMQEMAIPVLAFVAGPGEIAYWATLKDAFEVLNLQMPILAPRLNITIVTRQVEQLLEKYQLTVEDVFQGKAGQLKQQFIDSVQDREAKKQIAAVKQYLDEQYQVMMEHLKEQSIHLDRIIDKNKQYHAMQLDYLQNKIEQEVLNKHATTIKQFQLIEAELYPNGNYQERVYNPYQYLNVHGPTLISDILNQPLTISNVHYLVKI